jgi:hypothetical protein
MKQELEQLLGELAAAEALSLAEAEQEVLAFVRRFGAALLAQVVALRGSGNEGPRRGCSCGGEQKHQGRRWRTVQTLLGTVRIGRAYYQCGRCHVTAAPVDEQLGLGRGALSWGLQQALGRLSAALPFAPAVGMLADLTGVRVCAKTAQLTADALGQELLQAEGLQAQRLLVSGVQLGAEKAAERLYVAIDATLVPTDGGFKEAKIAAIYAAEDEVQAGETSYVSGYLGAEPFGERVYVEAQRRGAEGGGELVALGDGAAWIWNLVSTHFPQAVQILDWYHVKKRVWELGEALYGEASTKTTAWVQGKLDKLRAGDVEGVMADLRRLRPKGGEARKLVRDARRYFTTNTARMRYSEFERHGYHIGSGVVESACGHVIGQRQKLAGMRWSLAGAAAILALRTLVINQRWRQFWSQQRRL